MRNDRLVETNASVSNCVRNSGKIFARLDDSKRTDLVKVVYNRVCLPLMLPIENVFQPNPFGKVVRQSKMPSDVWRWPYLVKPLGTRSSCTVFFQQSSWGSIEKSNSWLRNAKVLTWRRQTIWLKSGSGSEVCALKPTVIHEFLRPQLIITSSKH